MPSVVPAYVTPALLTWAREEAGFGLAEAARRLKQPETRLAAWEGGEEQPSLRQAETMAKLYQRALSVFSLPAPPKLPPLAAEYRRLPGVKPGAEPPELRLAVRRLVQRRRLALHLFAELGDEPPDFTLRVHLAEQEEKAAARVRAALDVPLETQFEWSSEYVAFRTWRAAVERLGVLVNQFPGKGVDEVRGTSVLHFPLPVVGVNSKEIPLSKPFTLLHELVHLALAAAEEESPAVTEAAARTEQDWLEVERFCEGVAGAILLPAAALEDDRDVSAQRRAGQWTIEAMRRISRRYKVTPSAAATRLWRLRLMPSAAYGAWKDAWVAYRKAHPDRPGMAITSPAEKAVTRNGPLFTSLVLGALTGDRITSVDASHYLDVGYAHVEKLRGSWIERPASLAGVTG